ncbi:hypothetical protein R1sor_017916 [Riccia sorocarpa]|uniref:Uncharacterized protein n=1 Tax=Riccia sorocarpa TaxID=122646 RepID=A0ABD3IA06_9MARC
MWDIEYCLNSLSYKAASLADASPLPAVPPIRVEPKPRSGIRQQDLLKSIVEVKPKRQRISGVLEEAAQGVEVGRNKSQSKESGARAVESTTTQVSSGLSATEAENGGNLSAAEVEVKGSGLLGLAYETSDEEDEEESKEPPSRVGSDVTSVTSSEILK